MLTYLLRALLLACLIAPLDVAAQSTSTNAEARLFFDEGNLLYASAHEAPPGPSRDALLRRALRSYLDSLRIVRNRNALFNAAVVLEELGREGTAFNYYGEYLGIEGLSEEEQAEATRRREALRPRVAVLLVTSSPEGALVRADRKDLAPLGRTPLELALPTGEHRLFIELAGHEHVEATVELVRGEQRPLEVSLARSPALPEAVPVAQHEALRSSPTADGGLAIGSGAPATADRPGNASVRRLRNTAIGTGASTLATVGAALGLSIRARSVGDEQRQAAEDARSGDPQASARAEELADKTDHLNLSADLVWGASIGLGVTAITTAILHRKKKRRIDVEVQASAAGVYAAVQMPLGGRGKP